MLGHSSVQSVVIQQLAATELFCRPNVMCAGTVKLLGSVIKLLDDICEIAVQLSVHTVYRYGGYCCMCHGENIYIVSFMIFLVLRVNYISPFY